jgi:hypothetical protein
MDQMRVQERLQPFVKTPSGALSMFARAQIREGLAIPVFHGIDPVSHFVVTALGWVR